MSEKLSIYRQLFLRIIIIVRFIVLYISYNTPIKGKRPAAEKEVLPMMDVEFRFVRGHVEVFSPEGQFLFSADTLSEARMELTEDAA